MEWRRGDDPAIGDFRDAIVLRKFGDVPDDLSALVTDATLTVCAQSGYLAT